MGYLKPPLEVQRISFKPSRPPGLYNYNTQSKGLTMYGEKIDVKKAKEIIKEFDLKPGSFFTNTEPSHLCSEYRVETGFWLSDGRNHLIYLIDTKDENDNIVTSAYFNVSVESIGVEQELADVIDGYEGIEETDLTKEQVQAEASKALILTGKLKSHISETCLAELHNLEQEIRNMVIKAQPIGRKTSAEEIAKKNDKLRKTLLSDDNNGVIVTRSVRESEHFDEILEAVKNFEDFSEDNDPHGERDCALFDVGGERYMFKIDYYANDFPYGADPYEEEGIRRIITIMSVSEY